METKAYCGEYVAPEINITDIKSQRVLCASEYEYLGIPGDTGFEIEPW